MTIVNIGREIRGPVRYLTQICRVFSLVKKKLCIQSI